MLAAIAVAALVVLVVVDAGVANSWLRDMFQAKTGRALNFRRLQFHLLQSDPTIIVDDLRIGSPPDIAREDLVRVGHGVLHIRLAQLLRGHVTLTAIALNDVTLRMVRRGPGRNNYSFGGSGMSAALRDVGPMTVRNADASFADPQHQLTLQCRVDYDNARGARPLRLKGGGSDHGEAYLVEAAGAPLTGRAPTAAYAFNAALEDGALKILVSGATQKPFDFREFDLSVRGTGPNLAVLGYLFGAKIPNTPPFALSTDASNHNHVLNLRRIQGSLGKSVIEADFTSDHSRPRRSITASVHAEILRAEDLQVLFSKAPPHAIARSQPGVAAKAPSGSSVKAFDISAFQRNDVMVDVLARRVTGYLAPLNDVRLHLVLKDGQLRLKPFSAALSPGRLELDLAAAAGQGGEVVVSADGWIRGAKPGGFAHAKIMSGVFDGAVHLKGSGRSQDELLHRAQGGVAFRLQGGSIKRSQADALAGDLVKGIWTGLTDKTAVVTLTCARGRFAVQAGVLTPSDLIITTPEGETVGHGVINLATRRIDLTLEGAPRLPKAAHLSAPIHLTGALQHPKVSVDVVGAVGRSGLSVLAASAAAPFSTAAAPRPPTACPSPF